VKDYSLLLVLQTAASLKPLHIEVLFLIVISPQHLHIITNLYSTLTAQLAILTVRFASGVAEIDIVVELSLD
jgi:hypothetical protein